MTKNNKKTKIDLIMLIVFITYSIITMLLFKDILFNKNTLISWTGYLFTVLSFIIAVAIDKELFNENTESVFNSLPLSITTYTYLTLQIFFSLIAIPFVLVNLEAVIAIEVIILAIFLIIAILLLKSREYIESVDEDTENRISFIKGLEKEMAIIAIKSHDEDDNSSDDEDNDSENIKRELDELKDLVRYGNPVSNTKTRQIEENILKNLSKLKIELENNEYNQVMGLMKSMKADLNEREIIL